MLRRCQGLYEIPSLIGLYLLSSFLSYKLYNKAMLGNSWMAWIPLLNLVPFFNAINRSGWNLLWILAPVATTIAAFTVPMWGPNRISVFLAGFILIIYISAKWIGELLKAYGISKLLLPLSIIPIANLLLLFYMSFAKNIRYKLDTNKYSASDITI